MNISTLPSLQSQKSLQLRKLLFFFGKTNPLFAVSPLLCDWDFSPYVFPICCLKTNPLAHLLTLPVVVFMQRLRVYFFCQNAREQAPIGSWLAFGRHAWPKLLTLYWKRLILRYANAMVGSLILTARALNARLRQHSEPSWGCPTNIHCRPKLKPMCRDSPTLLSMKLKMSCTSRMTAWMSNAFRTKSKSN